MQVKCKDERQMVAGRPASNTPADALPIQDSFSPHFLIIKLATNMFKNSKSSSSFKNSRVSTADQERKETLEGLGYAFTSASKKSGWNWSTQHDQSDENAPTEAEAIEDAWRDAGEKAQELLKIPPETWARMGVKEQTEMINDALSGS